MYNNILILQRAHLQLIRHILHSSYSYSYVRISNIEFAEKQVIFTKIC